LAIRPREPGALRGQTVDVRCLAEFVPVTTKSSRSEVVRYDEENVELVLGGNERGSQEKAKEYEAGGFHAKEHSDHRGFRQMKPCITEREGSGRVLLLMHRLELHPTSFDLLAGGEFPFPFAPENMGALMGARGIGPSVGHFDRIRLTGCLDQVCLGP